jgi:hypothetical protein
MPYGKETYYNGIRPTLLNWISNASTSKNVANVALNLANRAQKNLWELKPWCKITEAITLSLVNNAVALPADFGRVIELYGNLTDSGIPNYWYYETDTEDGYSIDWNFSKDTNFAPVLTFYYSQQTSVVMRYQKVLEDFDSTVEGEAYADAQFSFFPANLVILECQKINVLEKGNTKEWMMIKDAHATALRNYINANQWVNYGALAQVNDRFGNKVMTESFSLGGRTQRRHTVRPNGYVL